MGKFGGLAALVASPYRVVLLHPQTGQPIGDKDGREAYVDVFAAADSDQARNFDREQRMAAARRTEIRDNKEAADPSDQNAAKLARLTAGWHLVDPLTKEPIDFAFSEANAVVLYTDSAMGWVRRQVELGAIDIANFMPALPKA